MHKCPYILFCFTTFFHIGYYPSLFSLYLNHCLVDNNYQWVLLILFSLHLSDGLSLKHFILGVIFQPLMQVCTISELFFVKILLAQMISCLEQYYTLVLFTCV